MRWTVALCGACSDTLLEGKGWGGNVKVLANLVDFVITFRKKVNDIFTTIYSHRYTSENIIGRCAIWKWLEYDAGPFWKGVFLISTVQWTKVWGSCQISLSECCHPLGYSVYIQSSALCCNCMVLFSLPSLESRTNVNTLWALFGFCKTIIKIQCAMYISYSNAMMIIKGAVGKIYAVCTAFHQ